MTIIFVLVGIVGLILIILFIKFFGLWFRALLSGAPVGLGNLIGMWIRRVKSGVIVPTKVERIALQNAASIGGLLLTTDAAIVEIKEKKEKKAGPGGGMDDYDY